MPTGYTYYVENGEITKGNEFILKCARAFGAAVMMRDESLDNEIREFEPSKHYLKELEKTKKKLEEAKNMTIEEAAKLVEENYIAAKESAAKDIEEMKELKAKYTKVLNEVMEWQPPTEDHVELKNFAIKQLTETINWDWKESYYGRPIVKNTPEEYINALIERAENDIKYYEEEWKKEVERTKCRNAWIADLKSSLK